jgi:Mce-associated membrane protein
VSDIEEPESPAEETLSTESVVPTPEEPEVAEGEALPSPDAPAEPTENDEAAAEPAESLTLPDERHSRTTELAARLRQSALAQVEAARAAQAAGGAISSQTASNEPKIPALDDASRRFAVPPTAPAAAKAVDEPDEPATVDEPIAATESVESEEPTGDEVQPEPVADEAAPTPVAEPDAAPGPEAVEAGGESDPVLRMAAAGMPVPDALNEDSAYLSGPRAPAGDRTGGQRLMFATAVVAVLTIAAAVLLVIFARKDSHDSAVAKTRIAALAAAKTETALALTYNYQTLDSDFAKAEAGMSKSFRANYAETAAKSVTPLATKTHAVTTATIVSAGVISASSNSARILIFADQTVENKLLNATSRLDKSVIDVSMVKQDGRWVIEDLRPI